MSGLTGIQPPKVKRSIWETIKAASGPYRRLFAYVKPYKWRFITGLAFGFLFGAISAILPLVLSKVMASVFHGGIDTRQLMQHPEQFENAPRMSTDMILLCLAIPAVMTARSIVG
ncbi:MAG TPA: hypothetical protein VGP40_02240, partial [Chthoniobacterales bacterium]|nr:hypothetical protein [Chthoniobacterales bacterium]